VTDPDSRPLIAVLDYGIGNLRSAQKALQHVGADARLTADAGLIRDADAVVLPGVGAFGACMSALRSSASVSACSCSTKDPTNRPELPALEFYPVSCDYCPTP
jgi:imidazoleglycerol phosphate synthase glutamine amidotransferase subunit HisH